MINTPRIGTDDNYAFPTMQLNIGFAEKRGSGMFNSMMHLNMQSN
jgi:hypothetical protein